ncbi:uncharacterized protein M6B38_167695 [Iris pallida]|uniref:Uncharacterized protein n=1 Tax=Iris pallida TaxID=29817 RepID=A0AAX6EVY5_IRIPA|nr:uncharacterized protein M6B38_167695 [Iris pallida]
MASPASSSPTPPPLPATSDAINNQDAEVSESKPEVDIFQDADIAERAEKLKKYESAYAHRLKVKYFSKKGFHGGDIFDNETVIDNETIKSSRWPCTRSFTHPVQIHEDQNGSPSSAAETSGTPSKKQPSSKKSS